MIPIPSAARALVSCTACLLLAAPAVRAAEAAPGSAAPATRQPTVDELLARYAEARGGAAQWAAVRSMGWTGHVETDAPGGHPVPFLMLFKRPGATRFEVMQQTQHSVHVFDGNQGWKMHPGGERGLEVDDYTPAELAAARDACGLDGPLADPAAKGVKIAVEGSDVVAGRQAWRLKVVLPSGGVQRHWIDAKDFRELRYDRTVRDRAGRAVLLSVWLKAYGKVEGLSMPMRIETRTQDGALANALVIEKAAINPALADDSFSPPGTRPIRKAAHGGVVVDTTRGSGDAPIPASGR